MTQYFVFPASRAQQRLYFLQRLLGDAPTYAIPLFFSIRGPLDVPAMAAAVGDVVRRHEALRTHFAIEGTTLMQVIDPQPRPAWRVDTGTDVAAWMAAECGRPFDLDTGPLFRAAVLRRGVDDFVLMLAMHHIVADGWSLAVLLRDLQAAYLARAAGAPASALAEPELQYPDFSSWQDQWLAGPGADRQLRHWCCVLGGDLPVLRLPTDRPRPAGTPATTGDSHLFALPGDAVEQLERLCHAEGCTLFAGLLAAFAVLLRRYSGLDDIVVGSPVANRTRAEFDDTVGLFVNTVAVRCDLAGGPTFRELLHRVGRAAVDAYANQELPFERVVQELNPHRGAEWDPVFQVMFSLHNAPTTAWDLPGLLVSELEHLARNAKFELELDIVDAGNEPAAVLQYRTGLFDAETIRRLAGHYRRLLESVADDPDRPADSLPIFTDAERAALLPVPRDAEPGLRCCHELFEERAARRPDAVAVSCGPDELTYRQLDERANRLAHRLRAAGVGPEVLVGLGVERSADLVVGILGIAKAGGAYLPLDPGYPAARLAFLVRDTGIRHLVVPGALADRFADFDGVVTHLDGLAAEPSTSPASGVTPDHLAYVIHTSGSTGQPKGTLVTHRNVARLFTSTSQWFDVDQHDVWTMFHSFAFDFSVWELWGALTTGGRLVVVPAEVSRSPADFHRLLREHRVTVLSQTPSAFRQLMAADQGGGELALRYVVFGGEALEPASLRPWVQRHGDQRPQLVNLYGITETTVHATYRRILAGDLDRDDSPIGVPLPDLQACVLDPTGEPAPVGVPGELVISGAGVARGYLGRPELSAQRFVPHPAAPAHPAYRTGDLARRLPGGELVYLGRIDDQVKIRGFRVEPGEVEAALVRHPEVREAVVLAAADAHRGRRLVGYVVSSAEVDAAELRSHLLGTLPEHLVPADFVVLDRLPLTPNGKVDRARLPSFAELGGRRVDAGRFAAPDTPVEQALAEVWAEVLGVERVGVDDNYFALGGDSIRSIQLLAAAERHGLRLALPDLLRFQTIRRLAPHTTTGGPTSERPAAADRPFALLTGADRALVPDGVLDAYPLTRLQAGMLYHSEAHRLYHNVSGYLVRAEYSEQAWRWAVATVLARHEILRTSFDLHRFSEPMQLVHAVVDPPITFEDLGALRAADQLAAARSRFADERARPLRWKAAPLLRLHVQRLGATRFRLWVTEHHAILDGWSERALFAELVELYLRRLRGDDGQPEPAPPVRFRDVVELEREALADEGHRRFWLDLLHDSTAAELPRWRPPHDEPDLRLVELDVADLTAGVERLASRLGTAVRTVLVAAHARVLGLLAGSTDVVTGVVHHGRPETAGGDQVLGLFLNTLPLRVRLPGGTWAELVQTVDALDREIHRHRRYPLAQLQHELGRPLFESFVNYTRFGTGERDGFEVLEHEGEAGTSFAFGAEFSMTDALGLALRFDAARFDAEQVELIGGYYRAVLAAMGEPDQRYDVDLLSDAEHQRLTRWNATERHYPQPHLLHELVRRQAERTPALVACEFEDERLSYAELDERADRLARRLVGLGAGPGRFVGVCLRRSLDLVVGLLATLKAGAAYLPVDPDDPPARIAELVGLAGAALVLAEPGAVELPGVPVVDRFHGEPHTAALPAVAAADAAYLIFTSGSTGRPKGVVVSHRAICNRLLWMQRAYRLGEGDAVLHKTPHTFDVSVWELFWPLLTGGRLVLARPGGHRDPAYLTDLIRRRRVSTVHFVPSMLAAFLDHGEIERCTSLRRVVCSGEALPARLRRRFHDRAPESVELHNLYGPTEAAVDVTHWRCTGDDGDTVPIGRPIDNLTAHVLDAYRAPVPVGVAGELYLGGTGLADGYHGEPELTARRFVTHPRYGRLYRTGDLARRRPDGVLEFVGRTDDQLKIRGVRVEPGEIEAALLGHDAVRDAAVVWHDDQLTGHVVLDRPVDAGALARWLGERLPAHLVPARWAVRDALPLSRNGKVDRAALRAATGAPAQLTGYVAPRDDREAVLAELVETVLGAAPVGVHDDFFASGGNSLSALRLAALVEHRFGRGLPLDAVLRTPTVAGLADAVRAGGSFDSLVPLRPGAGTPLFLVHPAGGTVFCYRDLAAALPPGPPVYGLAATDADRATEPADTVAALAERYLPVITALVPAGPYHLAGWSFGGVVAYELAHRLSAVGPVAIAMIDSGFPTGRPPADAREWFTHDLRRTAGHQPVDGATVERRFAVYRANLAAHAGYQPRPYRGPLLCVHSADSPHAAAAWVRLAGAVPRSVAADHNELMRPPHVAAVARLLADFLGGGDA